MPRSRIDVLEDIASTVEYWLPFMGWHGHGTEATFYCEHCRQSHIDMDQIEHRAKCPISRLRNLLRVLEDTK